jgi:hypothetical protein
LNIIRQIIDFWLYGDHLRIVEKPAYLLWYLWYLLHRNVSFGWLFTWLVPAWLFDDVPDAVNKSGCGVYHGFSLHDAPERSCRQAGFGDGIWGTGGQADYC